MNSRNEYRYFIQVDFAGVFHYDKKYENAQLLKHDMHQAYFIHYQMNLIVLSS